MSFINFISKSSQSAATDDQESATTDQEPATTFVAASASGVAVPVSEPLGPDKVRQLLSTEVIEQVTQARMARTA
jgi:hypothetical protein